MSEKRFTLRTNSVSINYPSGRIFDNKKQHSIYLDEVVFVLNEQQATINKLKEENKELEDEHDDFSNFLIDKGLEFEFEKWCKDE